VRVSERER